MFQRLLRRIVLAGFWLTTITCTLAAPVLQEPPMPHELAIVCFDIAKELAEADGGALWGISLDGPILIVDADSRELVANQADKEEHLVAVGSVWTGRLPDDIQPANTSLEWAGVRWTMIMRGAIANSRYERGRLLMHESFHRIQPELGHKTSMESNTHLDAEAGRTWLRLEMRALAEAMIHQGQQREEAAREALLFRSLRHALVKGVAAAEEVALEANEGLAEYTGLRLSGMPVITQEQRLAVGLERTDASPTLTRSFAYVTGPAWAILLDSVCDDWRKSTWDDMNMAQMYAAAISYTPVLDVDQLESAARTVAIQRYDGEEVFRDEAHRAARRAARLAELNAMFAPERALRIATGVDFRFSFDPNSAESLGGQRIFYRPLNASDQWGILEAPEGAVIDFSPPMSVTLPVPPGTRPESVSWKLKLEAGYSLNAPEQSPWSLRRERSGDRD